MHVLPGILGFEKISKVFLVIESENLKKKKLSRLRIESWNNLQDLSDLNLCIVIIPSRN